MVDRLTSILPSYLMYKRSLHGPIKMCCMAIQHKYAQGPGIRIIGENKMNDESFNLSMRKFLKTVGVTSQQKIEEAVRAAVANGTLKSDALAVKVTLTIDEVGLTHKVDGTIQLKGDA